MHRRVAHPGAVFLDRDGTINVKAPPAQYIESPDDLVLLPGVASAIRRINSAGLRTIVVTNQRGIALGRMTVADLDDIHTRLLKLLATAAGATIDAFFSCPHDIGDCTCRKPATGLFLQAQGAWPELDFTRSATIGDSHSDVLAGQSLGMVTVLLPIDATDLSAAVDMLIGA